MIEDDLARWLAPRLCRVHSELQTRYGLEQKPERGAADAAARHSYAQPPVSEREKGRK